MMKVISLSLTQTMQWMLVLNPIEDSIAIEAAENNPYVNIIAVRRGEKIKKKLKHL